MHCMLPTQRKINVITPLRPGLAKKNTGDLSFLVAACHAAWIIQAGRAKVYTLQRNRASHTWHRCCLHSERRHSKTSCSAQVSIWLFSSSMK